MNVDGDTSDGTVGTGKVHAKAVRAPAVGGNVWFLVVSSMAKRRLRAWGEKAEVGKVTAVCGFGYWVVRWAQPGS
jgi:hypothetical protein